MSQLDRTVWNPRWWIVLPAVLALGLAALPFWLASEVFYRLHRATFVTYRRAESRLHPLILSLNKWSREATP
jgi:hypothetical protein